MAQQTWTVKMHMQGRPLTVQVQAHSQSEARRNAEHMYPSYKAGSAQRS